MRHVLRVLVTSALVATLAVAGPAGSAFAVCVLQPWATGRTSRCSRTRVSTTARSSCARGPRPHHDRPRRTTATRSRRPPSATTSFVVEGGPISSAQIDHSVFQTKLVDGAFQRELQISTTRNLVPGQQCVLHLQLTFEDGVVTVDRSTLNDRVRPPAVN